MPFSSINQVECANKFKGMRPGFEKLLNNAENMKQVKACINQEDSQDQSVRCNICLVSSIVANKKALKVDGVELKKMRLDPAAKVEFPRYLSFICELCQNENDDKLKKHLREIIFYWFKDLGSIWKVQSNFRTIIPINKDDLSTYQWILFQFTNSKLTLVTIPIITIQDPTLLLYSSYAFVYNQKEKILSAFEHKDFGNGILEKAMVDNREQVQQHLIALKGFGEGLNERTKNKVALVNTEKYHQLYSNLKEKYLSYFVNIWSGMSDPLRLISLGIASSAYLLLLWEEERRKKKCGDKQSFIHLKCGNGLLVHILTNEGHSGKGIDIVRHKMWDSYDSSVILEESPIYPHKLKVEADWVIGLRSDELSPWVPIIAARSSCTTQFFLLPCCRYKLDKVIVEEKYTNRLFNYKYNTYLTAIAEKCGFKVERDQIPLKLYCFVSRGRTAKDDTDPNYADSIDAVVKSILKTESCSADIDEEECSGTYSYKVIKQDLIDHTEVNHFMKDQAKEVIISMLLSNENFVYTGEDRVTSSGHKWSEWNAGGTLDAIEFEGLLNADLLKSFKFGIESFVRQYKDVLNVTDGKVSLRDYRNENQRQNRAALFSRKYKQVSSNIKTNMCWFYRCHPQGCVLTAEQCYHVHGLDDANLLHFFL